MKNILILHGFGAGPEETWFPEAKKKFEKRGYQVFVPDLPGGFFPKKKDWIKKIDKFKPEKNWVLIGHSLGGVAILRFLESINQKVGQIILIATPYDNMEFGAIENFFEPELDWEKIKSRVDIIDIISEDNDPAVPLEHGKKYAQKLSGKLHVVPGYTHFHNIDLDFLEKLLI